MKKNVKAVTYLRVSGKGQVDGHGFDRQRETIARHAKANGIALAGEYRDEGVSGTKETADRAGLAAMLDRLEHNGVKVVLVERSDRIARDLVVGEIILGQLRDIGVRVIEAESGTDLTAGDQDNPTGKLIRQILGVVAEFEKDVIVLKLRAARERIRRDKGRCEGRKPYGDRPGEARGLERLRQLRRKPRKGKRLSFAKIADQLNAEQLPTRTGRPWTPGSVHAIVKRLSRPAKVIAAAPGSEVAGQE